MSKAKYSDIRSAHFGLGLSTYCHFTSPIRRYPDLTVHRIVKCLIRGEMDNSKFDHFSAFASKSAEVSSENEIRATAAERDIEDLYRVIYMSKHVGEVYRGTISSVTSFGLFVELENTCEGLVPISSLDGYFEYNERAMTLSCGYTVYALGKQLDVRIVEADVISRRIDMEIVSEE
jgi:ribonuclease R